MSRLREPLSLSPLLLMCCFLLGGAAAGGRGGRLPVPSVEAQAKAERVVKEAFTVEYAKRTPTDRLALAAKLLTAAAGSDAEKGSPAEDPATRYVMLRESRDLAGAAGDIGAAMAAADAMLAAFDAPPIETRLAALLSGSKAADPVALMNAALTVSDSAVAEERFEAASKAAMIASAAAGRVRDRKLAAEGRVQANAVVQARKEFEAAQAAEERLKTDPDDPEANLKVGRYRCFTRGDWKGGAARLAKGSDPALAALVHREAAESSDAAAMGDAWWDAAAAASKADAPFYRARAADWYRKALPRLAGVRKAAVANRVAESAAANRAGAVPFDRIAVAVRGGQLTRTPRAGGGGGSAFELVAPEGGILIGFTVSNGTYGPHVIVASVTPIFLTRTGRTVGQRAGGGGADEVTVEAKPGYAVGGLRYRAGDRLDTFSVVFMRIRREGLDPEDQYESNWLAGPGGGDGRIGCDGKYVVGIHGGTGREFDGLGLVQEK